MRKFKPFKPFKVFKSIAFKLTSVRSGIDLYNSLTGVAKSSVWTECPQLKTFEDLLQDDKTSENSIKEFSRNDESN